jgi:hypothetical protein
VAEAIRAGPQHRHFIMHSESLGKAQRASQQLVRVDAVVDDDE